MLGNLITRNLGEFDSTVKTYGGELVERLGERTQGRCRQRCAATSTASTSASPAAPTNSAEHLDKRLGRFEDMLAARVADMAKTLGEGGKEIVGTLDRRIAEISGTMQLHGERLRAVARRESRPKSTVRSGARADALADTLDVRYRAPRGAAVGRAEKVTIRSRSARARPPTLLNARMEQLSQSIEINARNAERSLGQLAHRTSDTIRVERGEAERALSGTSESVGAELHRPGRAIVKRSRPAHARNGNHPVRQERQRAHGASARRASEFGNEIERATDQALAVDRAEGLRLRPRDRRQQRARWRASSTARAKTPPDTVNRTLGDLQTTAEQAIAQSKETATATVSEMLETHNMLRSDATALFGRLREANIMLQEVLSGSHENMSALENTLMLRVSEFVSAMNEVTAATGDATEPHGKQHRRLPRDHRRRAGQSRPARAAVRRARPRSRQGGRARSSAATERPSRASTSGAVSWIRWSRTLDIAHRGPRPAAQALLRPAR